MKDRSTERFALPDPDLQPGPGRPWIYRIVVEGRLEASWSDRLAGLRITPEGGDPAPEHTVLVGPLRDQAELQGVLSTLFDLRLTLLSVESVGETPEPQTGQPNDLEPTN